MPTKITKKEHDSNSTLAKWRSFLGDIICQEFRITLFDDDIKGGIPFITRAANLIIGGILFGGGAVITGLLSVIAYRELFSRSK